MRVLLDVDGVLADFVGGCIDVLDGHLKREDVTVWRFIEGLPEGQRTLLEKVLKTPNFWETLACIPRAREGVKQLRENGFEIVFVTSPWVSCREWGYRRRRWLRTHFDASDKEIVFTCNKALIQGNFLIDDKIENVVEWQKANPFDCAMLYIQPYNIGTNLNYFTWDRFFG